MKLDYTLPGVMTQSSGLDTPTNNFLPQRVVDVPKDVMRSFPHSKRVGNYLLGKTLGEGSFAKVKEALHTLTGEKVAVKVIDKKKAKEDVYVRKNLRREGKLLQVVRHRHVIQLLEIMETENSYYLVTELCQGGDLMDLICSNKRLDESQTRKYIKQISSAVDYLHKAGILHRDLKVENLLLDHNKDIKIIDFGLSNSVRVSHTKDGGSQAQEYCVTQCGSPAYAAPELLGNKKYGPKVDIWSIGVNMYAMLTGNLPFTVEPFNIKALHNKMLKGEMNAIPETLSPECVDLLKQFLTADPESRISLANVMKHTWIIDGSNKPMEPAPFPNRLSSDHLDHDIIKHMASNMDYRMSDVIRLATNNIPNNATATYHLLLKKLTRYNEQVKAKGRSSSESRYTTPDSSKQAFRSGRRSAAAADVIRLTPVDKSHPRPPRRAVSQDFLRRQKSNTTDTQTKQKTVDSSQEDPCDTEKTLVRRKIQNARVLHRINGPLERKSPRKDKAETALKNEHLPIKGSDIKEEDEDEQDENIEAVEDDEEEEEEETVDEDRSGLKAIKGKKSPRLQRRYTDKLQVQEVITTALTPRSVHPAETVTTKMIGLPHIDKGDKAKQVSMSKTSENGSSSPRSMPRKVYPSFGYINKTKATAVSTAAHHQGAIRYGHKSPGEHSSNSTSSSRDGQKSTCSNPNPSTHHPPQHFAHSVENKGSVSDPSTKTEYKSINYPRPPAAKTVNIEMDSCDKYSRHNNTTTAGTDLTHRPLPSVSPVRTLTQNRRVVNIVYPPFNKARGLSMRQQVTAAGRQAMSCDFESGNSLNITGEKALLGDAGHLLDTGKSNIDCIPLKARLTKVDTQTSDHHQPDGPSLTSENTHKIVLPSLPMVETKAVNIT